MLIEQRRVVAAPPSLTARRVLAKNQRVEGEARQHPDSTANAADKAAAALVCKPAMPVARPAALVEETPMLTNRTPHHRKSDLPERILEVTATCPFAAVNRM